MSSEAYRIPQPTPWWSPARHDARRPLLLARGRIKSAIRAWFEAKGFVEVDTACLQVSPGNETHLHAFKTDLVGTALDQAPLYLHTSPEFAMKKLLAAGETRIFTFAPCFRNRERGRLHSPEFMMLEWYRAGASYDTLFDDCQAILRIAAETAGRHQWQFRNRTCDATAAYTPITLDDAVARFTGIRLGDTYGETHTDARALMQQAQAAGIATAADDTWSDVLSRIVTAKVEPELGTDQPSILYEYPAAEAALARRVPGRPTVAERFELYVCGVELANGFGELTDAAEQRRRFEAEMAEKARIYGERYPIDDDFLAALSEMPPASGCALGFDRLTMLALGAPAVEDVIWTPLPHLA